MKIEFLEWVFRIWYWYVNKSDVNSEILFMNYGFSDKDQEIQLDKQDERNRYSLQLYHQLAVEADLKSKDIVEIGCGRGGGLSYIVKRFSPASAIGVDLSGQAISFCKHFYSLNNVSFLLGDAQKLSLETNSCDVVINVESSHRYPDMAAFLSEVSRILRPGGYFLYTDYRNKRDIDKLKKEVETSGMAVIKERFINPQIIAALELDDARRRDLVRRLTPRFVHTTALDFAGAVGSATYKNFVTGRYVYYSYVMKKK
jgi:SAM-dependent methyltransferase